MAEFKIVLNDAKTGKSFQRELKDNDADFLIGKKIGDSINGETMDLAGYEFEMTGGSDKCGFPMRKDVRGATRSKILAVEGVGLRKTRKGMRKRKTVCGNTIDSGIVQINMKIIKYGKAKLGEEKAAEKADDKEAPAEKPAEEEKKEGEEKPKEEGKPEEPSPEEKPEEVKEEPEAPEEEKKEEAPVEDKPEEKQEEAKPEDAPEEKPAETDEKQEDAPEEEAPAEEESKQESTDEQKPEEKKE